MESTRKMPFSIDALAAGFLAAAVSAIPVWLVFHFSSNPEKVLWRQLWPILPVILGCVAVAATNATRWHSLGESVIACGFGALTAYLLYVATVLWKLFANAHENPLATLFGALFYVFPFLIFLIVVTLPFVLGLACGSGALFFGLLRLMSSMGEKGRPATKNVANGARLMTQERP